MSEYTPTEYVVDFGDYRSNQFVRLNMALIEQNGAKLHERIVRCRDCVHYKPYRTHKHGMMNRCHDEHGHTHKRDESDFCSRGERRTNDN